MAEQLGIVESLELETLQAGSRLRIIAGDNPRAYGYDFLVLEAGERPHCLVMQTSPDGRLVGPSEVTLEGTGRWTTRQENPVQTQFGEAFTISWGYVSLGGLLSVIDRNAPKPRGVNGRYHLQPACNRIEVLESIVERP